MKKTDFVEQFSTMLDLTKKETNEVVDKFIALITKTLKSGDEVVLPDMGKFMLKTRPAREARNPQTGAIVKVPAKIVPQFKPSKKFKTEVVA